MAGSAEKLSAAVADPVRVPAADAIVRALVGTDAELVLTDGAEQPDGVAALPRYADPATRHR